MGETASKFEQRPNTNHTILPNYLLEDCAKCVKNFRGTKKEYVGTFIDQIRAVQKMFHVNEIDLKLLIIRKLSGPAEEWFQSKPSHISMSSSELLRELELFYGNRSHLIDLQEIFLSRKWKWQENENFRDYFKEKVKLGANFQLPEQILVQRIIDGIDNVEWERQLNALKIDKTSILLDTMERAIKDYLNKDKKPKVQCCYCKKDNHPSNKCHFKPDPTKEKPVFDPCLYCKKTNHPPERCFFKNDNENSDNTDDEVKENTRENTEPCKYCKKSGHLSNRCYFKNVSNDKRSEIAEAATSFGKIHTETKKKTKSESSAVQSYEKNSNQKSEKKKLRRKSESKQMENCDEIKFEFDFSEFNFQT
ncbi:uncharacterized protein LOC134838008 [Culicoides brevitarsis]|uniref:uncharacterized protein LOC134838008 n=1 Tax=Culicoides brevitarsis TaxID=469753 RepID=UPI00307B90D5